jgi:hypothetical protein
MVPTYRLHKACINARESRAASATLLCRQALSLLPSRELDAGQFIRDALWASEEIMSHLIDKHFVERANAVLLLSVLWGALAACVIGALVYDIGYWLAHW